MKSQVNICFGLLNILVRFLINESRKDSVRPVCQLTICPRSIALPHKFINEKLINLIEWTFKREGSPFLACNARQAFFIFGDTKR